MSPQPNPIKQTNIPGVTVGDWADTAPPPPATAGANPLLPIAVQNVGLQFALNVLNYGAKGDGVTDDTDAVQAAINAASAKAPTNGITDLWLPSGYKFMLGQLSPANGVRIWAYGAQIAPVLSEIVDGLFYYAVSDGSLSRFEIRGGSWIGTGTEGSGADPQTLIWIASGSGCNDILLQDMYIANWGAGPLFLRNPLRARVLNNTLLNVGQASPALRNSIDLVVDNTVAQGQDLQVSGNIIEGSQAAAIAYVNVNNTGPGEVRFAAIGNICSGVVGGNDVSGAINIEFDGTAIGAWSRFIIADNHITNPLAAGAAYAIVLGQSSNDAAITQAVVQGNTLVASASTGGVGIECFGNSDVTIEGNRISAPTPINATGTPFKTGNRYSAGPAQGKATLVAGAVTVDTAEIQAGDNVLLTRWGANANEGDLSAGTVTQGVSFVINSSDAADTSTIYWRIDH